MGEAEGEDEIKEGWVESFRQQETIGLVVEDWAIFRTDIAPNRRFNGT